MRDNSSKHISVPDFGTLTEHTLTINELIVPPEVFRVSPYCDGWEALPSEALRWLMEETGRLDGRYQMSEITTSVAQTHVSFYPDTRLIRAADGTWNRPDLTFYWLLHGTQLIRLTGVSPVIHDLNKAVDLQLSVAQVADYLRFFCTFVHGEDGPFMLIEDEQQACLPKGIDLVTYKVMSQIIRPVCVEGQTEDGAFVCSGSVFYSNALFLVTFHVFPHGIIEMIDDDPVATDLPVSMKLELR